jgi:hypothetical protein
MATSAQMSVMSTKIISTLARKLLRNPNCSGVNKRLKIIFKKNGSATRNGSCPRSAARNTHPKVIMIMAYKTVQTGPNNQAGGAQAGFISSWYQSFINPVYPSNEEIMKNHPRAALGEFLLSMKKPREWYRWYRYFFSRGNWRWGAETLLPPWGGLDALILHSPEICAYPCR